MEKYLFVSHAQEEGLKNISYFLREVIRREKPTKIISLGDINGSKNSFVNRLKDTPYFKIRTSPPLYHNLEDEFMPEDILFILLKEGLEDIVKGMKEKKCIYSQPKNPEITFEDLLRGIYPFVISYETKGIDTLFMSGCEDYFNRFLLCVSPTTRRSPIRILDSCMDDNFLYFPGTDQITGSRTLLSHKFSSGSYILSNLSGENNIFDIPKVYAKKVNFDGLEHLTFGDFTMVKIPSESTKRKDLISLVQRLSSFKSFIVKVINPIDLIHAFEDEENLSQKVVASHLPLGRAYEEIGSPIRVVAHGLECGQGFDLSGNPVPEKQWTDELVLNPSNLDEGKIGVVYSNRESFSYKIWTKERL